MVIVPIFLNQLHVPEHQPSAILLYHLNVSKHHVHLSPGFSGAGAGGMDAPVDQTCDTPPDRISEPKQRLPPGRRGQKVLKLGAKEVVV